ncbi:MAG: PIN domain-containing protein [Lachnospiraceae bacterium]|nr:PIN domain-containing protein [Lachnospiraceae bacterium]
MRVLFDTCVILDALQAREPFREDAEKLFLLVANERIHGALTAKSITDIYYLTHRITHNDQRTREILMNLLSLFDLVDTTGNDIRQALLSELSDYEDAVMVEAATREEMDCIVTRNLHEYRKAACKVLSPSELLKKLAEDV